MANLARSSSGYLCGQACVRVHALVGMSAAERHRGRVLLGLWALHVFRRVREFRQTDTVPVQKYEVIAALHYFNTRGHCVTFVMVASSCKSEVTINPAWTVFELNHITDNIFNGFSLNQHLHHLSVSDMLFCQPNVSRSTWYCDSVSDCRAVAVSTHHSPPKWTQQIENDHYGNLEFYIFDRSMTNNLWIRFSWLTCNIFAHFQLCPSIVVWIKIYIWNV